MFCLRQEIFNINKPRNINKTFTSVKGVEAKHNNYKS